MSNELQTQQGGSVALPEFMQNVDKSEWGVDNLAQYVSPPYIKIVQKQSKAPYNEHPVGTVMAVPQNIQLFGPMQEFHVIPIFTYTEFVLCNPYVLSHLDFIRERSFDPQSNIALRARDFNNRTDICPEAPEAEKEKDKYKMCYFEHINFVCLIEEHEVFRETPIVFTFRSGEFKTGKLFAGAIKLRQGPMYGMVFKCWSGIHKQGTEENFGLNFTNPDEDVSPWVTQERFNFTHELHKEFAKTFEENRLQVNYGDDKDTAPEEVVTPEM